MKWRSVKGYEGFLEVSDEGEIRSVPRYVNHKYGKKMLTKSRIIKGIPDPKGYLKIRTSVNGRKTAIKVHRAVAEAFIPNPENKEQVDHIDGNKRNNHVSNLRWVTNRENFDYSVENGLRENSFKALTDSRYQERKIANSIRAVKERCQKPTFCYTRDGKLMGVFESATEAAKFFGGVESGVSGCCRKEISTYKNMIFRYAEDAI